MPKKNQKRSSLRSLDLFFEKEKNQKKELFFRKEKFTKETCSFFKKERTKERGTLKQISFGNL